jgi:hypothetical protein
MTDQSEMVRIRFRGSDRHDIETLWAVPVGDDAYRLDNSPFFAYGVSWQDTVEAQPGRDEFLEFVRRLKKSGNRTLRIIFQKYRLDDIPAQNVLRELRGLGCSYEGMQPRMVSLNIPPNVDLDQITDFLNGESGLEWEYADPTYDEVTAGQRF